MFGRTKRSNIRHIVILSIVIAGTLLFGISILFVELRELIQWRQQRLDLSQAIAGEIRKECSRYIYPELGNNTKSNLARIRDEVKSRLDHNLAGRFGFQARFDYEIVDANGQILLSSLKEGRLKFPLAREKLDFASPPWQLRVSFCDYGASSSFLTTRRLTMGIIALFVIGAAMVSVRLLRHERKLTHLKSQFISHVSHEMRTPASTIRVIAEMFKMGKVKDRAMAEEYYDTLISESERLTAMINNVLDFARIESHHKTYALRPCDPGKVALDAINLFKTYLIAKDYQIKYDIQPGLPWINADVEALTQMICNLLDNAAKYSLSEKEINVRLFFCGGRVAFEVEDRGIGIAPQEQDKIFEPFYRVDDGTGNKTPGTGVGLAIVNNVVKMHNGEIRVNSRLGQGSTFTVLLPVIDEGGKT
jgi:signal transduction histidine kinase